MFGVWATMAGRACKTNVAALGGGGGAQSSSQGRACRSEGVEADAEGIGKGLRM